MSKAKDKTDSDKYDITEIINFLKFIKKEYPQAIEDFKENK